MSRGNVGSALRCSLFPQELRHSTFHAWHFFRIALMICNHPLESACMRRIAISVVCACVASSALADDAGRGRASNGSYQTASADMSALESAARFSVWPMVGATRTPLRLRPRQRSCSNPRRDEIQRAGRMRQSRRRRRAEGAGMEGREDGRRRSAAGADDPVARVE